MNDSRLQAEVDRACAPYTEYYETWAEIREYYQDNNKAREWIGALAQDLTGSEARHGKEYENMRRNIERWFDGTRSVGPKSAELLRQLGQRLPPKKIGVPPGGLDIKISGWFQVSEERRRYRDIDAHFDEMQALDWVQSPDYESIFEEYGVDGGLFAGSMEADVSVSVN